MDLLMRQFLDPRPARLTMGRREGVNAKKSHCHVSGLETIIAVDAQLRRSRGWYLPPEWAGDGLYQGLPPGAKKSTDS